MEAFAPDEAARLSSVVAYAVERGFAVILDSTTTPSGASRVTAGRASI
jgi:hypothetical protein